MNSHRYILEPYKGMTSRYNCPGCQYRDKTFALYIDTVTGVRVAPNVGRCNRESNCGYHYTPKQYFQDNGLRPEFLEQYARTRTGSKTHISAKQKPHSFIDPDIFKESLKNRDENNFVKFLTELFGADITRGLIETYFIGSSKHWPGATVFWQIASKGESGKRIRTGKIMLYSPATGKRVKEPFNHITWVHSVLRMPEFELGQCLFGEHLLTLEPSKPVAIVESEKTAIIASVYIPQYVWLAAGSLTNLNAEKCPILKGRNVVLWPDLKGFEKWSIKAKELSHIARFVVSDLLERKATEAERKQGLDLADYLIKFDYRDFISQQTDPIENLTKPHIQNSVAELVKVSIEGTNSEAKNLIKPYIFSESKPSPETWTKDISELEQFFSSITMPALPIRLNQCSMIIDIPRFIKSHLATVKTNNGERTFLPYLERLQDLKILLTSKNN